MNECDSMTVPKTYFFGALAPELPVPIVVGEFAVNGKLTLVIFGKITYRDALMPHSLSPQRPVRETVFCGYTNSIYGAASRIAFSLCPVYNNMQ
jgi:hypothetical protein